MKKCLGLLVALFCLSCSSKQEQKSENDACVMVNLTDYLEGKNSDEIVLSTLVDSLEYIPLQTPDDLPVDVLMAVRMSSDYLFVMDRQQRLYRFDKQGRFLNLIGGRGEGPEEYISAVDFEVDEREEVIYLFDIYRKKIKAYRISGAFLGDIKVPDGIESMALMDDSCFIGYKPWYMSEDKADRCVIFGKSGEVVDTVSFGQKEKADEVKVDLFRMPDFSQISGTSRFRMPFESAIFLISDSHEVTKEVDFELGEHRLPVEVSMNNELYNKSLDKPYVFELNANRNAGFVYMSFFYQKKHHRVVYGMDEDKFHTVSVGREPEGITNDLDGGATFWPLWFASDRIIGVLSIDALDMEYTDDRIRTLYNKFKEYDNPVLQIGYK